jgi:hypothetical protein
MRTRALLLTSLACACLAGMFLFTSSANYPQLTQGTSDQWKQLCDNRSFSCSILDKAKSTATQTSYMACGKGQCFEVTCKNVDPSALCEKTLMPGAKPVPRKLQTVIGTIL